ncbi:hypothetical protein [Nesterenkonia sp. F]|uniref:hypothetical protein n=1 Tax=Nesterenkonia sp. F TaxID=795955 RepID=UPI001ED96BD2|nr:hypothetical protein [Nesterenkonia sp. F]
MTADDAPVAHALLTRCHIGRTPALALAPCAASPNLQGHGAGSAAIRGALEAAAAADERAVVVLGHPGYYPRFGFSRASAYDIDVGFDVPDESLMVLNLDGGNLPSGRIRYARPFGL